MTDVDVTPKVRREKDVEYVLETWNKADIPKAKRGGVTGGTRNSPLNKQVEAIREAYPDGTPEDEDVLMGRYGNDGNGATSAVVALNKRFKDQGFKFYSRQLDDGKRGLFASYDPA